MQNLERYRNQVGNQSGPEIVRWSFAEFGVDGAVLASSLGPEDQILTEMAVTAVGTTLRLFTLDTGRLFQETYETMQRTMERYRVHYDVYAPDPEDLRVLVRERGPNLFYESREQRRLCCEVRKTRPLKMALAGAKAWICGLRRDQAITREAVEPVSWDENHGLYKISPLFNWTEQDVWTYVNNHGVPVSTLHNRGFRSIGCAPCTRATNPGEDVRAGRWWWESRDHKECGLHR